MTKILVLEDEASIRSFIMINLKKNNFEIVETASGEEALEKLDETDIMEKFMGENFGYDLTQDQRALFREVLAWSREEDDLG